MKAIFPALFSAVAVLASPLARQNQPQPVSPSDFELLNLLRIFKSVELSLWDQGLANFTDNDFDKEGFLGFRKWVEVFQSQDTVQFTTINQVLGDNFTDCTFTFPVSNPEELLTVGQIATTVVEAAIMGILAGLESADFRLGSGAILGVEARQNSKLREVEGVSFFNGDVNFDTSLTPSQAYSIAEPVFSCPASNPPINFPLIPSLQATFTGSNAHHKPGDEVTVTWDKEDVKISGNVFVYFISGFTAIEAPLQQTGKNTGTTTLPKGIQGTAFLVLTDYQGPAPIPQVNNLAIGYLVVT